MVALLSRLADSLARTYSGWIVWNLFLAFIPLVLSFWLFRRKTNVRSPLWWLILVTYVAFLPNAPYVLTDIIHLLRGAQRGASIWLLTLVVIPIHLGAIISGFEAYVIALINQAHYLKRQGAGRFISLVELMTHALCAIGIYLGRFRRFNSWELVLDPTHVLSTTLDDLTSKRPVLVTFITFLILTVLYWVMKQITIGLMLRLRYARMGVDGLD